MKIVIHGPVCELEGLDPKSDLYSHLRTLTSYPVKGAEFSDAFQKGVWDGRKHLMGRSGTFPTGLLPLVTAALQSLSVPFDVEDLRDRLEPQGGTFDLKGVSFEYPYDYQLDAAKTMVEKKQGIVRIATNGGKTEIACAVTQYIKQPTVFIVTTRELLYQAQARFLKRLDATPEQVGLIGDGHWAPGSWVTVATLDTLSSRIKTRQCQEFLASQRVLFFDECHHLGSETWYDVSLLIPATYRFGLSGTPLDRSDGADMKLVAATGDVIVDIPNKFLVDRGVSARAHIIFDSITQPALGRMAYPAAYKKGIVENEHFHARVVEWVKVLTTAGLQTLVLTEEIKHGQQLDSLLWTDTGDMFIPHQYINGEESTDTRQEALKAFADGSLPVLIASTILDEGVDVPTIDALVVAGSRKSRIKTMQRLGRGLRGKKLILIEFSHYTQQYLLKHSLERYQDYKQEECFPLYSSGPDVDLVKRLWQADS